jgi:hypothetical protein
VSGYRIPRSRLSVLCLGVCALLLLLAASGARALTLEKVGGEFDQPIYVTSDPGNANRLFVVEREGTIQLLEGGTVSQFTDISAAVGCGGDGCAGERGLLSIALSPQFASDGRLFVDYADDLDGTIHVAELSAAPDRKSADPASLKQLLEIEHDEAANHDGGQLQFGPDGALYVSTGDGGGSNDEFHHSQDLGSQLGKILRIDTGDPAPVTPQIWNLGLRNPYRFSFDSLSGDMVIGDVGQGLREEIDFAPSPFPGVVGGEGVNYGWNCREGLIAGPGSDLPAGQCASGYAAGSFADPVFDYGHNFDPDLGAPSRCSITGGYVVRDPALGALSGSYVYSDYCSGVIRTLRLPATAAGRAGGDCSLGLRTTHPVSFGEDAARRLYVVEQGGQLYRLAGPPPAGCPAPLPPSTPQSPPTSPAQTQTQTQTQTQPLSPTYIGIKAQRRRVERGRFALLTVWVSPCEGRRGQLVELLRNESANGSRYLSRACTARFVTRIRSDTTFAALVREERGYLAGRSRQLTIRLAAPQPRRR